MTTSYDNPTIITSDDGPDAPVLEIRIDEQGDVFIGTKMPDEKSSMRATRLCGPGGGSRMVYTRLAVLLLDAVTRGDAEATVRLAVVLLNARRLGKEAVLALNEPSAGHLLAREKMQDEMSVPLLAREKMRDAIVRLSLALPIDLNFAMANAVDTLRLAADKLVDAATLRCGLTAALDLASDTSDMDILAAVARARIAEVEAQDFEALIRADERRRTERDAAAWADKRAGLLTEIAARARKAGRDKVAACRQTDAETLYEVARRLRESDYPRLAPPDTITISNAEGGEQHATEHPSGHADETSSVASAKVAPAAPASAKGTATLPIGALVRTTADAGETNWNPNTRRPRWGVIGRVYAVSDCRGPNYRVVHKDGSSSWYGANEVEAEPPIGQPPAPPPEPPVEWVDGRTTVNGFEIAVTTSWDGWRFRLDDGITMYVDAERHDAETAKRCAVAVALAVGGGT